MSRRDGFTLAELLVATTIASIVMAAVYTAMHSTIRLWRMGEENLSVYQDARMATTLLRRDLTNIVPESWHLVEGSDDEISFCTVTRPMDVDLGTEARLLWVHYRVRSNPSTRTNSLIREEAVIEEQLPPPPSSEDEERDSFDVETGRSKSFTIARELVDLRLRYLYMIPPEGAYPVDSEGQLVDGANRATAPPPKIDPRAVSEPRIAWGAPQGMTLDLIVPDDVRADGKRAFSTTVLFRDAPPLAVVRQQAGGGEE